MDINDLAKALQIETGADDRTVWKWLAGGRTRESMGRLLTLTRERIEGTAAESRGVGRQW